ncbi:tripartite tricarboxylate transporter TctB family protein [Klebsiella oxytoca]|uniref:tripartite tricarboxylate transporter TctB family protein n=1 Tax=Klebsiella oxytoca TaxID=571 RepID=UPI00157AF9B6|nr:tripartite tricarboxylate transporter TctB family protein [Klebsiella oxytoca]
MSDRIFAGIWLLLCTGGMFIAWQIHSEYSYEPVGPRPFPVGIIGLMLLCSVLLLLRRPDVVAWPGRLVLQRLLTMVVVLMLYAWGFEWLGFPLATALLTAVIGLLFGATLRATAVAGAVMGIALWYAFDTLLDVTLPPGVWLS